MQEQLKSLQAENISLRELLKAAVPLSKSDIQEALSTEEEIAEREIEKLNELSKREILTFEESKRLMNYVQLLETRRNKTKDNASTSKLSDEELLKKLNE